MFFFHLENKNKWQNRIPGSKITRIRKQHLKIKFSSNAHLTLLNNLQLNRSVVLELLKSPTKTMKNYQWLHLYSQFQEKCLEYNSEP